MAALPVWLAVQDELLRPDAEDSEAPNCFDDYDDDALFHLLHLTRPCVTFIMDMVRSHMGRIYAELPADEMVLLALNHYAHGISSPDVLQRVGLSRADRASILIAAVSVVISDMCDQFVSFPLTPDAKTSVASMIQEICGIPNVLGVLAPAHFKIRASPYERNSFGSFVNTLGQTSIVSQIICDSDGNVLSVDQGRVGSSCEQDLWESSARGREIEGGKHGAYWLIGGKGYNLSKHVLTPLSLPMTDSEIRFNEAHAKIHNIMHTTLGSIKSRFRCLTQLGFTHESTLNQKSNIIKSCCVLHNIAKKFSVPLPPMVGDIEPLHPGTQRSATAEISPAAIEARQKVINDNFSSVSNSQETPCNNIKKENE